MLDARMNSKHRAAKSFHLVAAFMGMLGLAMIIAGGEIEYTFAKISVGSLLSNVGGLIFFVGVFQWLFDSYVRSDFFSEIRLEILGNRHVLESGISGYYEDSKEVSFVDTFITTDELIIGVNYSAKLIDNSIQLLKKRVKNRKKTTIVVVSPGSEASKFLAHDYKTENISGSIDKIREICRQYDPKSKYIKILGVDTILRYSFVLFDNRAWIVVGTSGAGRRAVPGFFVTYGGSWFNHYREDIKLLVKSGAEIA